MGALTRYIEWMSRGRRTNREAYVLEEWDLPKPVPDAEWRSTRHLIWLMSCYVIPR